MANREQNLGKNAISHPMDSVDGTYVNIEGERFYKISNVDQMDPFFISLVSDSDHWLFAGSSGGISAGRKNEESSLFAYYTDDKIVNSAEHTGSKTIIRVIGEQKSSPWEPFSIRNTYGFSIKRNLYSLLRL